MIILDTNVVSEAIKPAPNATVRAWLNAQIAAILYLTHVTQAELLFGVAALADGYIAAIAAAHGFKPRY